MAMKIIKIYDEAINEILVAANDSEKDVDATDPEDKEFELVIWCNYKWIGMFFHLLDLTALNFWILLTSCGPK